ncbi:MAG: bifunctional acetate--CoA ligase family protein/GNAT family N-acetyltransferase, partial [Chlamydiae bacterium]|nr:bifunctional acetate--CoA ligase family protein/GNAT family N-acetyltransferase [Chlamydiota bacterium]
SAKAAASHTGSLSGSDAVLNAALKRVGVLRVDSISDLFSMADILSKQPAPKGPNLAILTNAGGPGVIATDALIENGGKLAQLESETYAKLNSFLPKEWSHNNPVDILGDATSDLYYQAMQALMQDKNCDGVLIILTPQYMTDANAIAEKLKSFAHSNGKPVLASFMGADAVSKASKELAIAGIPTFEYPDSACKAFAYMLSYAYSLRGIYETPVSDIKDMSAKEISKRQKLILNLFDEAYDDKRVLLDEFESKKVLKAYGLPVVDTYITQSKKEARACAEKIGFPVVLKLFSKTITHKTDVGGVKLNLNNADAVEKAYQEIFDSVKKLGFEKDFQGVSVQPMIKLDGYELILGSSVDKEFGPIILFGTGGHLVEVFKDSAIGLPPLTSTLAKRLMERTKIYEALKGVRGRKGVDLNHLEQILVKFSNLIADYPQIKECDINPLIVSEIDIIAVDARIVLHEQKDINKLPKLAIRPYPINYVQDWTLKNKREVTIRPIKPEDEPAIVNFIKDLSEKTIRQRYLQTLLYDELLGREKLIQICFNDYDREIALVAELKNEKREKEILAIGRLTKLAHTNDAAFAILVKDAWHGQGLGKKLLSSLIEIAKNEKIERLLAQMFTENIVMQKLCAKLGFKLTPLKDKLFISAELDLKMVKTTSFD